MTPRERLRVTLMFTGVVFAVCGIGVACAAPKKELGDMTYRFGAWKDGGIGDAVPKEVAPWLIAAVWRCLRHHFSHGTGERADTDRGTSVAKD